jgi:hypothetical protein
MNIAKKRMFLPPDGGGIGLFNLRDFLDAQKCAWIKRSKDLMEPWKIVIYISNHGNLYNVKGNNVDMLEYPICHNICKSFERFTDMYIKHNENFREGYIFDSKCFTIDLESRVSLNRNHFDNIFFTENSSKLYKLRYDNFYDNHGNLIGLNEIRESTGLALSELQIYRCRGICSTAKIKYCKKELSMQKTISIETFINRKKKGSSHIRKILMGKIDGGLTKNINKFANNIDIIISGEQSVVLNGLWTKVFFSNQDRTFFFKLYNNTLGYNNAVAHFVQGHSPYCTFCDLTRLQEQNLETPLHLFYECRSVCDVVENVLRIVTNNENFVFSRREYFSTFERREASYALNQALTIITKFIIKYIWDCRNRIGIPNVDDCIENIKEKLQLQYNVNSSLSRVLLNSGLPFFGRDNFMGNNFP